MDVEDRVRGALREAPAVDRPADVSAVAAAVFRHQRRRVTAARVAALAAVMVVAAGAVALRPGRGTTDISVAGDGAVAGGAAVTGTWRPLPESPLPARFQHQGVWTGKEMVVAGGCQDDCSRRDAAAYDPATRRWRRIADLPAGEDPVLVAAGGQVVVVAGHSSPGSWAWDPATDRWRSLGAVPLSGVASAGTYLVWTGTEVLAVGQFGAQDNQDGERGGSSGPVARLDLRSGTWRTGAAAPALPIFGGAAWTGSELLVAGDLEAGGSSRGRATALAYDPAADRWREIASLPSTVISQAAITWSGTELVVAGMTRLRTPGAGAAAPDAAPVGAAALDPASGRWRPLPDAPVGVRGQERHGDLFADGRVVTLADGGRIATLDPATGAWAVGAPPPVERREAPVVWSGDELLQWGGGTRDDLGGGSSSCCRPVAGGEATDLPR